MSDLGSEVLSQGFVFGLAIAARCLCRQVGVSARSLRRGEASAFESFSCCRGTSRMGAPGAPGGNH